MTPEQTQTSAWFKQLRDDICAAFEILERECNSPFAKAMQPGQFVRETWTRDEPGSLSATGGGVMSMMRGRLFEKVGVNISTVSGTFNQNMRISIPGAEESDGKFWAAGISLVAHFHSPHIPPVHFNTRYINTSRNWFGGGSDLNPIFDNPEDTEFFHNAWKECCDKHDPDYYTRFKEWADEYFFIKHRNEPRGIGGIFYDYLENGWEQDFAFTQDVGMTFLETVPELIRKHMDKDWTPEEREKQLIKRGRYVEFNLVYDRGTVFGLQTGGNPDAVLMSLPPVVKWP